MTRSQQRADLEGRLATVEAEWAKASDELTEAEGRTERKAVAFDNLHAGASTVGAWKVRAVYWEAMYENVEADLACRDHAARVECYKHQLEILDLKDQIDEVLRKTREALRAEERPPSALFAYKPGRRELGHTAGERKALKVIEEMWLANAPIADIAERLNGMPTAARRDGKPWKAQAVSDVVRKRKAGWLAEHGLGRPQRGSVQDAGRTHRSRDAG